MTAVATTRLAMIRHAPTDWNARRHIQGQSDTALSAEGRAMAQGWHVPTALDGRRWIASPLGRAIETAALLGHPGCDTDARLMEMDWGAWAGATLEDLRRKHGAAMVENEDAGLDFRPEGGESPREVQGRIRAFLSDIAASATDTVAVTHRGVLRAALGLATGWDFIGPEPLKLSRSAILMVRLENGGVRLDDPPLLSLECGS